MSVGQFGDAGKRVPARSDTETRETAIEKGCLPTAVRALPFQYLDDVVYPEQQQGDVPYEQQCPLQRSAHDKIRIPLPKEVIVEKTCPVSDGIRKCGPPGTVIPDFVI